MKRLLLLGLVAACGNPAGGDDAGPGGPVTALTSVPRGGALASGDDFFSLPFPSNFYKTDTGLDLALYPRPSALVNDYVEAMQPRLDGFGRNAAAFARFDGVIDPATLPQTPEASRTAGSSVYLVDVDANSPDRGTMWPLVFRWEPKKQETIGTNWIAAMPYPGFPLEEGRTYAMVVTTRVMGADGTPVSPSADWLAVRDGAPTDADLAHLQAADQPLLDWLDEAGGDERADVASAAVFTTQHSTDVMPKLRERVYQLPDPALSLRTLVDDNGNATYHAYEGIFDGPNFQSGTVPYLSQGGEIIIDTDGLPIVQRMEALRVAWTIPTGQMPQTGWPVVIYAHGTGGNYTSFERDGTATRLAQQGLAVISMDQVLHGTRSPADPETAFFNFANPLSARDNTIQGAADDFSLLRVAVGMQGVAMPGGGNVSFDPSKIYFFGHSQGGLTGPPFIAFEPMVKGSVLSGAGGVLYLALLTKTKPVDITALVAAAVRDDPLDQFDPTLSLLQTWIERADPVNYGPLLSREPAEGEVARPIFQSEGFVDSYAPPPTIEGFATSIGGDLITPVLQDVPGLDLRGSSNVDPPVTGNRSGNTVVLAQYTQSAGSDGHFVVFDVPAAETQSSSFLGTLASTGQATVVAP